MPYNPDPTNTTAWKFTCSCTFGDMVDAPPGGNGNGQWDPTSLCTERNAKGIFTQMVYLFLPLLCLGAFIYACDTMVRLRRRSRKSCCKTKLMWEIIGIILQTSTFFLFFLCNSAQHVLMNNGVDHYNWLWQTQGLLLWPQPLFSTLNTIVIAITWQHVGKTAAYY
jgi:hypothetical protein